MGCCNGFDPNYYKKDNKKEINWITRLVSWMIMAAFIYLIYISIR